MRERGPSFQVAICVYACVFGFPFVWIALFSVIWLFPWRPEVYFSAAVLTPEDFKCSTLYLALI